MRRAGKRFEIELYQAFPEFSLHPSSLRNFDLFSLEFRWRVEAVEIKLHACLTWALCGDEWLTSHAGRLTAGTILPGIP
jgi:hypothetical protein